MPFRHQIPDQWRSKPILVRTDSAGASNALINEMTALGVEYSLGFPITESVRTAVGMLPSGVWTSAITAEGAIRDGADVAEITGLLTRRGWPESMRVIVHRERPHPGAQLSLFEERDGCRVVSFCASANLSGVDLEAAELSRI